MIFVSGIILWILLLIVLVFKKEKYGDSTHSLARSASREHSSYDSCIKLCYSNDNNNVSSCIDNCGNKVFSFADVQGSAKEKTLNFLDVPASAPTGFFRVNDPNDNFPPGTNMSLIKVNPNDYKGVPGYVKYNTQGLRADPVPLKRNNTNSNMDNNQI